VFLKRRSLAIAYHSAGDHRGQLRRLACDARVLRARSPVLFEKLLSSNPGNARAQRDAGLAYKKLGAILEKMGDRTAALANYRKAVALDDDARAGQPE